MTFFCSEKRDDLLFFRELGVSEEKVNVNGGSIALGHPIGMPYLVMQNFLVNLYEALLCFYLGVKLFLGF
jgi:hypothetical protein